jgi:hypothetical protein
MNKNPLKDLKATKFRSTLILINIPILKYPKTQIPQVKKVQNQVT